MTDSGSGKVEQGNALQIFHVNFNCSDLDRTRAFYESIGFKVVNDFSATGPDRKQKSFAELGLAPILNLPTDCDARFGRLCLKVKDCHALYARLVQAGRTIYRPPVLLDLGGTRQWVFCCEDPDGIVIEFMQFLAE